MAVRSETCEGFRSPFLVGCQRCKMPASRHSALLKPSSVSLLPQYGHPASLNALVLTDSCQLWPHSPRHHTRAGSQRETSDGLRDPFRSPSHCASKSACPNRRHHSSKLTLSSASFRKRDHLTLDLPCPRA